MTILRTVRVAAIQATPVILDAEATVAKTVVLLAEPAQAGAELAVLPETFVSLYPSNAWAHQAATFRGSAELWERMWLSSVDVPGPLVDEFADACRSLGSHAVIAINERESRGRARSTTRCCGSARTGCCTSTASSCRRSTSACFTASGAATTCA